MALCLIRFFFVSIWRQSPICILHQPLTSPRIWRRQPLRNLLVKTLRALTLTLLIYGELVFALAGDIGLFCLIGHFHHRWKVLLHNARIGCLFPYIGPGGPIRAWVVLQLTRFFVFLVGILFIAFRGQKAPPTETHVVALVAAEDTWVIWATKHVNFDSFSGLRFIKIFLPDDFCSGRSGRFHLNRR